VEPVETAGVITRNAGKLVISVNRKIMRSLYPARQRHGKRKRTDGTKELLQFAIASPTSRGRSQQDLEGGQVPSPSRSEEACEYPSQNLAPETPSSGDRPGYLGDQSVLTYSPRSAPDEAQGSRAMSIETRDIIIQATKAACLPTKPLAKALIDLYFQQLFYRLPVVDRQDVAGSEPSLLLLQSLYLVCIIIRRCK
jgi:hypothetical protein